jgi:hypothetical protein
MSETKGWAVIKNDHIYVKTVSDTRRAAIINWLVTEKQVIVKAYNTDADIEDMWRHFGQYVDCRPVTISLTQGQSQP